MTRVDLSLPSNQRATQLLARDVLCLDVGDRLPTSLQYQEQLGVGSGTVQKALRILEGSRAAGFTSRGHQGTFVARRHLGRLWAIAGLGAVTGAMPLPDSREGAGLAAGLRNEFDLLAIPLQMRYMHGSAARLEAVRKGRADFAVLSAAASVSAREGAGAGRWIERDLGPCSYYSEDSLGVLTRPGLRDKGGTATWRVGIDRDSYDHMHLTLAEFPPEVGRYEYKTQDYQRLPAAVAGRVIDTAVWHRITLPIPLELLGVTWRALVNPRAIDMKDAVSRAVVLARCDRREIEALLRRLDVERIRESEDEVVRGEAPPVF